MSDCTVYIDESGDLGVNRGTRWFVLSAVIVDKADERKIRETMSRIKTKLNINSIHLRKTDEFNKRGYIVRELNNEKFTYMNVLVDTTKFDSKKIPSPLTAYNYVCKYLLQRVSWFLRDRGKVADVVLSSRGTSRDNELILYIKDKLLPYPNNNIYSEAFEKISAKTATSWDMLQLADVCATTTFLAFEVNGYGFTVPCYSHAMRDHLYRSKDGKITAYGIKYFTDDMIPNKDELWSLRTCASTKKERTPSATTT